MTDGSWDRHVRRVQAKNRRKYTALLAALEETMGDKIEVMENGTGLHLLVRVPDGRGQDELIAQAAAADVAVYPTGKYWADPDHHPDSVVLIGFSSMPRRTSAPASRPWPAPGSGRDRKAVIESLYGKSTDIPFETLRYAPCVICVRADTDGVQSRRP